MAFLCKEIVRPISKVEAFFPMPAAGFLLMSSNISLLPLCFCFASCNVSRETTTLTSVLVNPFFCQKKKGYHNPLLKKTGY